MSTVELSIGRTPNYASVTIGPLTIHFSHRTPIGFECRGERMVRENDWGPTTGKHLNALDGGNKAARVPADIFEARLAEVVGTVVPA